MPRRAESIKDILNRTLRRMGFTERLKETEAVRRFKEIVGENIAAQAEAVSIKDGKLHVKVASPVWRQQLNFSKTEMIESINTALGEKIVTDIYFSG